MRITSRQQSFTHESEPNQNQFGAIQGYAPLKRTLLKKGSNILRRWSFTFIELMLVIVLFGVLSSLAIANFRRTFEEIQLRQFGNNIIYLSEYVHASAIAQNKTYCLLITAIEPVTISTAYLNESSGATHPLTGRFGRPLQAPGAVNLVAIEPSERTKVFFYPDGSSDAMVITFANLNKSILTLTLHASNGTMQMKPSIAPRAIPYGTHWCAEARGI